MHFEIVGPISFVRAIASGLGVRDRARLRKLYGGIRWRKLKGLARIRFGDGIICVAELHWYEAHGVGRREMKIKRLIRES